MQPAQAANTPSVTARFAIHDHFDRLVLTLPAGAAYTSRMESGVLRIRVEGAPALAPSTAAGHRMLGVAGGNGEIAVRLAPDTHPRLWRLNGRLVVDIEEGAVADTPSTPMPAARKPDPARAAAPKADPLQPVLAEKLEPIGPPPAPPVLAPLAPPADDPPPSAPPAAITALLNGPIDVDQPAAPTARAAVALLTQGGNANPSILVPFGADTGAAAFRRGADAYLVFDTPRALDLGQLKDDPAFGGMTERLLADGVQLRMPLPPGQKLQLARQAGGWTVTLVHDLPAQASIAARAEQGVLAMAATATGRVVVLDDEATGGKLLLGTQRASGQSMAAAHLSPEFAVLPTWQGVAIVPQSDRISLVPLKTGFRLSASDGPRLSITWVDNGGHVMTRRFDLPDLPPEVLQNRLALAQRDAALTPKLARFPARLRVAQALLAEGLDVDARAVLHAANADDPAHADDADATGLSAIAAWLIARAGGAYAGPPDTFDPATLGESDEGQFWRALMQANETDLAAPAATLAATWPLLQQYPAGLRRRLVQPVGDILDRGGQDKALTALLAAFPDPSLDLVRADLLKRQGKIEDALALLDAVARRPDRLMGATAARQAVEIRLAARKLDEAGAAAALGRQIYAWRGGPSDLALRMRVADLRARAGQWRPALALLRETDTLFPDSHGQISAAEGRIVSDLLRGDSANGPSALDLVALADEAAPLLSAADADATLAPRLVDKLLALDLPARAEPILRRLFDHAASSVQKAELGVRLAGVMADRGDARAALAILDGSDDATLESRLVAQRGLLRARLLAATGHADDALGILSRVQGEASVELQAKLLEDRHDWAQAGGLLNSLLASGTFAARPEQAQRDLILRLARDESEAGDMAALRQLRVTQGGRFASGPGAELFAVLTEEPILAVDDLPRAGRELQAVRDLPASLASH